MTDADSESEKVVSVSARGQATIPKEFREELGIETPGRVKFVRTDDGEIVVRPIRSVTDLRGVLAGKSDAEGRSGTERLRTERDRDAGAEADLRRRYAGEGAEAADPGRSDPDADGGDGRADAVVEVLEESGIRRVDTAETWRLAAEFKGRHAPSLGDAFALGTAAHVDGVLLVGGDDFDAVTDVPVSRFRTDAA